MDLFGQVPWGSLRDRVGVFELDHGWGLRGSGLSNLVTGLQVRGIDFAFQAEPLSPTGQCGSGVKGFEGPAGPHAASPVSVASSIAEEGARTEAPIRLVLDAPFTFGHLYDGRSACRWSVRKVAREVAAYGHEVLGRLIADAGRTHQPFAGLEIGDVEPLWAGIPPKDLEDWIAAYRRAAGSELAFFHLRVDFTRPDWAGAARELETFCRTRGIPFGMVYEGGGGATGRSLAESVERRFATYETKAGGRPDQIVLRSPAHSPGRASAQRQAALFAGLIDRYLRTRTRLEMEVAPSVHAGSFRALGTLTSGMGTPVANAKIEVSLAPVDGPGSFDTYSLEGVVPSGATEARVGFRVDTHCVCGGTTAFVLYGASYADGGGSQNRVPNAFFSRGLHGWDLSGSGGERLEATDRGTGSMLRVRVDRNRATILASGPFTVRPGTRFSVEFAARVAPVSVGTGSFVLEFVRSSGELLRESIPLAPISYDLGTATTDDTGSFHLTLHPPGAGDFVVRAWFAGDDALWPASQEGPVFS